MCVDGGWLNSQVKRSYSQPIEWEHIVSKAITIVATVAATVFGAAFMTTAGLGTIGTLFVGAVITLLCGAGGFLTGDALNELIQEREAEYFFIVTLIAEVGAVIGFFAVGGIAAAGVGALALPGIIVLSCVGVELGSYLSFAYPAR